LSATRKFQRQFFFLETKLNERIRKTLTKSIENVEGRNFDHHSYISV